MLCPIRASVNFPGLIDPLAGDVHGAIVCNSFTTGPAALRHDRKKIGV
jgi:hypothetical protein